MNWFIVLICVGCLYEVDMCLCLDGLKGLLVLSFDVFVVY